MSTDHRAEAEKEIRFIKRLTEPDDIRDSIAVASMHALLAIHDLLDERLPRPDTQEPAQDAPSLRVVICVEGERSVLEAAGRRIITTYQIEDEPEVLRGLSSAEMTTRALAWLTTVAEGVNIEDPLAARLPQTPPTEPEPEPLDEELDDDIRVGRLRIENGWLVEDVGEHTCGTGHDGHYGHHEPGCGTVPVTRLDDLPGWPQTPPSSAPAAPVSDAEQDQAPIDPQDATGPQKGAGRIGWLRPAPAYRFRQLAYEVEGGWTGRDYDTPEWIAADWSNAVFTPLLPGFFVAPDGENVPTIWRETDGEPVWMMVRTPYFAAFFDAVAGLLETREEA